MTSACRSKLVLVNWSRCSPLKHDMISWKHFRYHARRKDLRQSLRLKIVSLTRRLCLAQLCCPRSNIVSIFLYSDLETTWLCRSRAESRDRKGKRHSKDSSTIDLSVRVRSKHHDKERKAKRKDREKWRTQSTQSVIARVNPRILMSCYFDRKIDTHDGCS